MQLKTRALVAIAVVCALMIGVQIASAQNVTTGTLVGVVMDAQKAVLPGATVVAVHGPTKTTYETVTQSDGRFTILAVRVGGPYTVTASMPGFKSKEESQIEVALGESRAVEFVLALQTVTESVTVVAATQLIDTTKAGTGSNVGLQTIESMPSIARSINDFARTSPFVNISQAASGNDQEVSVAGRPNRYNNMLIDGAVNNDVFGLSSTGTPGGQTGTQPVSLDVIQEIQVLVSPYDVRQGGFSGGGINAVTKSGTNNFHGTAYYFGRSQKFMGTIPQVGTFANPSPGASKVGAFTDKQLGFSIGGPVLKNRIFFFGNMDWARKLTPVGFSLDGTSGTQWNNNLADVQAILALFQNRYGYNPGGVGEVSKPNNSDKIFVRTDFNLSSKHQLTARVNYVDALASVGSSSASSYNMPDHYYSMTDKMLSSVAQLNSTFGSSMFNELRVTYQRERNIRGGQPGNPPFPEVRIYMPNSTSNSITLGTEYSSMANKLNQDIIEFTDDVTLVKGNHTISVGTHNEFYKFYNLFIQNAYGWYSFSNFANLDAGLAQQFYHYYSNTADPNEAAQFSVQQFGFYAGDKWRAAPNFTVTFGARVDLPRFPDKPLANPVAAAQPFGYATDVVPSPAMWSPRAGFNWNLSKDGSKRFQVRGGVGMFTGRTPYVWLSNQYGNTGVQFTNISTSYSTSNMIPFVADPNNQPTSVTGGTAGRQTINVIDPNYSFPSVIRANLAVDRELGFWGLVGTAEVLYSKTLKDIYYQNLNMRATGTQPDGRTQYNGTGAQPAGTAWSYGQQSLRPDPNLNNVLLLTNTNKGHGWSAAFKVERPFSNGFKIAASYLYGTAYSTVDGTSSVANSNFTGTPVGATATDLPETRSNYSTGSRINLSATIPIPLFLGAKANLSFFYNGQSGRPYDLRYNQDANGDSASGNDLLYIPMNSNQVVITGGTWDNFYGWLQGFPGALDYQGQIMPRNALRAPWSNQVDLRFAVNIPLPRKMKVELTADILNLLNLIDSHWGWQWWGPFPSSGQAIGYSVDTATGLPRYSVTATTQSRYGNVLTRDDLRSRWQAQFGARFRF